MKSKEYSKINLIIQVVGAIIIGWLGYYQIRQIDEQASNTTLIIFGILIIVTLIFYIINWGFNKYKGLKIELQKNRNEMKDVKKKLNQEGRLNKIEKDIGIIKYFFEKNKIKGKKGQFIDPRIILTIVIIYLIILYLKSAGLI
ncbi:hypothetical protein K8R47_03355 [archaeon]|nr:hypothetical protein [archaeon]